MHPENWFRRNSNRHADKFGAGSAAPANGAGNVSPQLLAADVPNGLAVKCDKCGDVMFSKDFEKNLQVCLKCGHHHRLSAENRLSYTVDEGSFEEFAQSARLKSRDFLPFPDYDDKLGKAWKKAGTQDSFVVGTATIETHPLVIGVSQFAFMGGSMGSVAGEKIALALEEAIERYLPVVLFTTSGGARMQEGLTSLMQMAKTSAACARLAQAGLPLIVVMTDPTTAGVMASYASLGDVLLAEPGALVAFTGQRVAAQAAQGQKLPPDYQLSEWRVEQGHIDAVVARRDLRAHLGKLLGLLSPNATLAPPAIPVQISRNGSDGSMHSNGVHAATSPVPGGAASSGLAD